MGPKVLFTEMYVQIKQEWEQKEKSFTMNNIEVLKAHKRPLDIIEDIYRWAEEGFEAIPPEQYDLLKWYGLFHRKQTPGYFMLRMRISNGLLDTYQLRTLAGISRDFGRGVG
ncbi:hypothetical protein RY27_09720, partial [Litorilinea aerophila]